MGWIAILFGLLGMFFLYEPHAIESDYEAHGDCAPYFGVFGACAYAMVSKAGRSNHPLSVVFYFSFVAMLYIWFGLPSHHHHGLLTLKF